jgi:hypothetical protein
VLAGVSLILNHSGCRYAPAFRRSARESSRAASSAIVGNTVKLEGAARQIHEIPKVRHPRLSFAPGGWCEGSITILVRACPAENHQSGENCLWGALRLRYGPLSDEGDPAQPDKRWSAARAGRVIYSGAVSCVPDAGGS